MMCFIHSLPGLSPVSGVTESGYYAHGEVLPYEAIFNALHL